MCIAYIIFKLRIQQFFFKFENSEKDLSADWASDTIGVQ
jgi:hypothetical protein